MFGTVSTYGRTLQVSDCEDRQGQVLIARDGHIYKLVGVLGRGGLSTVYRAIRFADGEVLALKIAAAHRIDETGPLLKKEAEILKRLNHTNIVKLLDEGETREGEPFIVLGILRGETLEQVLGAEKVLPLNRAANICLQVASALEYAHSQGVIHKDIKPANIMIIDDNGEDTVVLYDFGIATAVESGISVERNSNGSLLYAAPEQLGEEPCSFSTDVYQLALVLFETLTGRLPFEKSVASAWKYRHTGPLLVDDNELGELALGEQLRLVLLSALERNPLQRTSTMANFAESLYQAMLKFSNSALRPQVRFA